MLVLTVKEREPIFAGPDIVVTILGVKGDDVRVGIDAPMSVPIERSRELVLQALSGNSPARPGRTRNATAAKG